MLEQTSREDLEGLYRLPHFFKAVEADVSQPTIDKMVRSLAVQIDTDRKTLAEIDQQLAELAAGASRQPRVQSPESSSRLSTLDSRLESTREELQPQWLLWARSIESPDQASLPSPGDFGS